MEESRKIAAFDLDGTLVDSSNQIHRSLNAVLQADYGIFLDSNVIIDNLGQPINIILDSINIPRSIQPEIIRKFRQNLESEILSGSDIFAGAVETLRLLKSRNFLISIATTKPTYLAKMVVKESALNGLVDFVQGTDGFPPKPNPEILNRISHELSGRVEVMFGDRTEDMRAAKSYSTFAVGVAQSAHAINTLIDSGADRAFLSFDNLLQEHFLEDFFG